jgi:hypothetical protein
VAQIVQHAAQVARRWLGTPFIPHACIQGAGVDCVQLVAAVYWETGAIDDPRFPDYTMDGGEHRISSQVLEWLEAHRQFERVTPGDPVQIGDVAMRNYGVIESRLDERRISTNEQARPVPYFCGIARLAVTFISEAFGVKSKKIKMRVGKKKETVGYNYFASFAALIAHGPLDRLNAIWMDNVLVWEGPLVRSGDYADIKIEVRRFLGNGSEGHELTRLIECMA